MQIEVKNKVAAVRSDDIVITDAQAALDLMVTIHYDHGCNSVAIPKSAVTEDFFVLSNGVAGEILQKFSNYRMRLAIIGDYSHYTSRPLRDFIYESNKGGHVLFVASEEEALVKLEGGCKDLVGIRHCLDT